MAYLVFQFPINVDAQTAIRAVADHFGVDVPVPQHIKQAVERVGAQLAIADLPSEGVETNPAIAFGGLLNGAGNVAPSSADAATSTTAPVVSPVISQITPPASSVPAPPTVSAAVAPTAPVAPTNLASVEFDSTGLAWDERIHSGNKTKTPGGEWRTKKGTDKGLIKSVELELRAKHVAGNVAPAANASNTNAAPSVTTIDPAAARAYAHAEALRVAGPQLIDDVALAALQVGQPVTLTPEQNDWFSIFHAKYHAAHAAYVSGNVVTTPPAAPASTTPTGSAPVAQPAAPLTPAASPTVAVTTVAPAPTAPQGAELDATGLPHDTRIHIGAKLKDTAGVWIQRHDVPGETKLLVMAELRKTVEAGNGAAQVTSTPVGNVSTPVAPLPPVVPVVSAADAGTDFAKMMQWIVANQMAGRIAPTAGPEAAKTLGFVGADGNGQLALMTQQIAYLPYIVQILQGQGAV